MTLKTCFISVFYSFCTCIFFYRLLGNTDSKEETTPLRMAISSFSNSMHQTHQRRSDLGRMLLFTQVTLFFITFCSTHMQCHQKVFTPLHLFLISSHYITEFCTYITYSLTAMCDSFFFDKYIFFIYHIKTI